MQKTRFSGSCLSILSRRTTAPGWALALAACLLPAAYGQTRLDGPVSGYVFDSGARAIRPIVGLPGASYLGDALVADVDWASVAPNGKIALAANSAGLFVIRGLDTASPAWTALEGVLPNPERAAWSPDASAAAIAAGNRVQVVRELGASPACGAAVELAGTVTALAMIGSGDAALAGVESAQAGGLYLVSPGDEPRLVARLDAPAALALAPNGRDLFVADRASRQVFEIRNFREEGTPVPVAADVADPVGLAAPAGGRLFVAARSSKTIAVYDLASRTLAAQIDLDFEPAFVEPLAVDSLFLLKSSAAADEPLLVLSAGQSPAVYFVPAGRGE